jgi:anti-sigma B factor antagonist
MDSSIKPNLTHETSQRGDVVILALKGRMDAVRVASVRQLLSDLPQPGKAKIVLDLGGMDWIDSSGVGALIVLYKRARQLGGDVKVADLQRQPKEIFRLLRLESAFEVCETVDAAIAKLA